MIIWSFWEAHWPSVLIIISIVMIIAWLFWPDETTYHRLEREVGELYIRRTTSSDGSSTD
jgi:hypothetical protein